MKTDMTYTTSPVMYIQLKEDRKGKQKEILEVAKQGDINMFTVIKFDENHHAIIECGKILRYHCCIKCELFRMLEEMTAGNRRNYRR